MKESIYNRYISKTEVLKNKHTHYIYFHPVTSEVKINKEAEN